MKQSELNLDSQKCPFSKKVEQKIDNFIAQNHRLLYSGGNGNVYVLLCKYEKIYVGYSEDVIERIKKQFRYKNTSWLSKYPPVEVITIIEQCDIEWESLITKFLMIEYGINEVRGGPYTSSRKYINQPQSLDDFELG